MFASVGSRAGALPDALVDLAFPMVDRTRRRLPESSKPSLSLVVACGIFHEAWGVTKGAMAGNVREHCMERDLDTGGDQAPTFQAADMLAAHDSVTIDSRKTQ